MWLKRFVSWRYFRRWLSWLEMRKDWDRRARQNARHFIDCGHGGSDREFWTSGCVDLDQTILRDLEVSAESTVVEIGCGIGRLLRPFSEKTQLAVGFDISREMVTQGRALNRDRANLRLVLTSGRLTGLRRATVDLVYSFIVFQHMPDRRAILRYLAEAARVLKGGGVFRFQLDGRADNPRRTADTWDGARFTQREIEDHLRKNRMEVIDHAGEGTAYSWFTARRLEEPGRARTSLVRFQARVWNLPELLKLLKRLGCDPKPTAEKLLADDLSLRQLAERFDSEQVPVQAKPYVSSAYQVFLGRNVDEGGLDFYSRMIEAGIEPLNVVDCLLGSPEFADRYRQRAT